MTSFAVLLNSGPINFYSRVRFTAMLSKKLTDSVKHSFSSLPYNVVALWLPQDLTTTCDHEKIHVDTSTELYCAVINPGNAFVQQLFKLKICSSRDHSI